MGAMVIGADLAKVYEPWRDGELITTLAWGDRVEVVEETATRVRVALNHYRRRDDGSEEPVRAEGEIKRDSAGQCVVVEESKAKVLRIDFVDVQQGDGAVIETPEGRVILVDGGDNQLFARYLAGRFRGSSDEKPREIDCIIVSHGDADHFEGLTKIYESESNETSWKRLFIHPKRVFHNGLVKGPDEVNDEDRPDSVLFGATEPPEAIKGEPLIVTELEEDLREVPDERMNGPFKAWKEALLRYTKHGPIEFRRLEKGDADAFKFLEPEGMKVEVLAPTPIELNGKRGLKFLGTPRRRFGHPSENQTTFSGFSASHTINGQSIVFRLTFDNWHFLFAGDLNEESEKTLVAEHEQQQIDLRSEVLKVPHHGSEDFEPEFLDAVEAVVSIVSAGDDAKEYIHPRATLMSALGKAGRESLPVVFVTEMVAFFKSAGWVPLTDKMKEEKREAAKEAREKAAKRAEAEGWAAPEETTGERTEHAGSFFAFSRSAYGLIRIRTDGKRLLVYTNSGREKMKEAYAYTLDTNTTKRGGRIALPEKVKQF